MRVAEDAALITVEATFKYTIKWLGNHYYSLYVQTTVRTLLHYYTRIRYSKQNKKWSLTSFDLNVIQYRARHKAKATRVEPKTSGQEIEARKEQE